MRAQATDHHDDNGSTVIDEHLDLDQHHLCSLDHHVKPSSNDVFHDHDGTVCDFYVHDLCPREHCPYDVADGCAVRPDCPSFL